MVFFNVFLKTLGFLSALLVFVIIINLLINFTDNIKENHFSFIEGDEESENIIATINLNGPIFNNANHILTNNFYNYINPAHVKSYLEELKTLKAKILIIYINSPGGTVSATAELKNIFENFKKETNIKIYFLTNEILASGGYWIATSADKIFASYGSIIGSIGVSGPSWFYYNTPLSLSSGIIGQSIETKNGIEVFSQNAGQGKDLFNPYRKPKDEEIMHLQKIVDEIYIDFISKVSKSRKIDLSIIKNEIGALIYSSKQAKDNFLIDDILEYEKLIEFIVNQEDWDNYKIYESKVNNSIVENIFLNFKYKNINKNYTNKFCEKLETTINVMIPFFLKDC